MPINDYVPNSNTFVYTSPSGGTTRKVVTVKEYDEEGRLVRETVTEETYTPQQYWYQPTYPSYPTITYGDTTPPLTG
jgi:hypothetical protein